MRVWIGRIVDVLGCCFVAFFLASGVSRLEGKTADGGALLREVLKEQYGESGTGTGLVFDREGIGYLGTRTGLFRIDGTDWRKLDLGKNQRVYGIDMDIHGRVFVGLFDDFGYVGTDHSGEFKSLFRGQVSGAVAGLSFDKVLATDTGVYAKAGKFEYFWSSITGITSQLPAIDTGGDVFTHAGDLYRLGFDWSLRRLDGGRWSKIGDVDPIEGVEPEVGAFSRARERLTCVYLGGSGLYWFDGRGFSLCHQFEEWLDIRSIVVTRSESVVVGIQNEGVRVFDQSGKQTRALSRSNGLVDASMIDLAEDADARIWIVQERGISLAQIGNEVALLNAEKGLDGEVNTLVEHEGSLFAGTSLGLYRMDLSESEGARVFRKIGGVGECRSLELVEGELFVGTTYGLFLVRGEGVELLYPAIDASRLKAYRGSTLFVLVGSTTGLSRFSNVDGKWIRDDSWYYDIPVYSITPDGEGNVWLDAGEGKTRRIRFEGDATTLWEYTVEDGLSAWWTAALEFDGRVAFTTKSAQLLGFDEVNERFEVLDDLSYYPPPGPHVFRQELSDASGQVWVKASLSTGALSRKPEGNYMGTLTLVASGPRPKVNSVYRTDGGVTYFALKEGLVRYDEGAETIERRPFETRVTEVVSTVDGRVYLRYHPGAERSVIEMERANASIRVSATVNQFHISGDPVFEYNLVGPLSESTGVVGESSVTFEDLPAGDYSLEVRAFNPEGASAAPARVAFRVVPPFYATKTAFGLYVLLGSFLCLGLYRARTVSLARSHARLSVLVEERTRELEEKNVELAEKNQELKDLAESAQQAASAKASFLAVMSHEIRTPLNGVIGMCTLLNRTPLNSQQSEFLRSIKESGYTLLEVVNDILDYSKIEKGKMELEEIPFDIVELVEGVCSFLGSKAIEKGLNLDVEIGSNVDRIRMGDPNRVRQVLYNLLGNAIKFTPAGRIAVSLEAPSFGEDDVVAITVSDTGVGIAPDKKELIFDAFNQSDISDARKFGGTGLGLSISKKITRMMDGEIEVESEQGKGSSFRVTVKLPVQKGGPQLWNYSAIRNRRVLIFGKDKGTQTLLGRYLSSWRVGYEYVDINELLRMLVLPRAHFDCVIVDIRGLRRIELDSVALAATDSIQPILILKTGMGADESEFVPQFDNAMTLTLPIVPSRFLEALVVAVGVVDVEAPRVDVLEEDPSTSEFEGLTVLVAEDNKLNRDVIQRFLEAYGVELKIVSNGREAVDEYSLKPYDLVLMDVQMPEMSGIEAARSIMGNHKEGVRPFIYCLSAGVLEKEVERCKDAGMVGFLKKPFQTAELEDVLRKANEYKLQNSQA